MNAGEKRAAIALAGVTVCLIAVWLTYRMAVAGAFLVPPDGAGWFFHYQGLVAGVLALISAVLTIYVLVHDLRAQEARFREEMRILSLHDRLLVSRETYRIISQMNGIYAQLQTAREGLDFLAQDASNAAAVIESLKKTLTEASQWSALENFSRLASLLDEDFLPAQADVLHSVDDVRQSLNYIISAVPNRTSVRGCVERIVRLQAAIRRLVSLLQELRTGSGHGELDWIPD